MIQQTKRKAPKVKRSLNSCFLTLGALKSEVYQKHGNGNDIMGRQRQTLRQKFSKTELIGWAENLYRKALIKNHPDGHKGEEEHYTKVCQALGEAFLRIKHILRYR